MELLLKTGALYLNSLCKKGGAALEQSGAGRRKVEQKKLKKKNCPKPKQMLSLTKTNRTSSLFSTSSENPLFPRSGDNN